MLELGQYKLNEQIRGQWSERASVSHYTSSLGLVTYEINYIEVLGLSYYAGLQTFKQI